MRNAAEKQVYGVVNIRADKRMEFQVHLSDAETQATTWSITDRNYIVSQLQREIHAITSNKQMRLRNELSIRLI